MPSSSKVYQFHFTLKTASDTSFLYLLHQALHLALLRQLCVSDIVGILRIWAIWMKEEGSYLCHQPHFQSNFNDNGVDTDTETSEP